MVFNLKQFVFYDDLWQQLNTVSVDFQVIHPDNGYNIVDNPATEAYLGYKVLSVGMDPVLE